MLKIAFAAGLMLSPAILLAQPAEQMGNGMGTQADAAPHGGSMGSSMSGSTMTRSTTGSTTHHRRHTTRGASPSNDTMGTPNSSNSRSSTLNPMPH